MRRLAIINCKSKKKNYKCPAEEMYSISFQFRAQIDFIKEYYDDYAILSTKYGIIFPTTIIEPYEISLSKGARLKNTSTLNDFEVEEWSSNIVSQIQNLSKNYNIVDLHISKQYLKHIKSVLEFPNVNFVKQPVNPGLVKNRYVEVLNDFKKNNKVCLDKIGEIRESLDPEIERWWYHQDYSPFFGFARHLKKKYPLVDEGNAARVSRGINPHTCGWVVNKMLLSELYKTESGQWRIKK